MAIGTILLIAFWAFVAYQMGKKDGESEGKRKAYHAEMRATHPYFIVYYPHITLDKGRGNGYFKSLKKARENAMKLITKDEYFGTVEAEKVEITDHENVIETFITSARKSNIVEIDTNDFKLIDPMAISNFSFITFLLKDGTEVQLSGPNFSLFENSFYGKQGWETKPGGKKDTSMNMCVPLIKIERVLTST